MTYGNIPPKGITLSRTNGQIDAAMNDISSMVEGAVISAFCQTVFSRVRIALRPQKYLNGNGTAGLRAEIQALADEVSRLSGEIRGIQRTLGNAGIILRQHDPYSGA